MPSALARSLCSETGDKPLAFVLARPTLITPAALAWELGQEVGEGESTKTGDIPTFDPRAPPPAFEKPGTPAFSLPLVPRFQDQSQPAQVAVPCPTDPFLPPLPLAFYTYLLA